MKHSGRVSRNDVRQVTVILAGSRTGSSFLFSALKSLGQWITPTGEETPFYRLAGLGQFNGLDYSDVISDQIPKEVLDKAFNFLAADLGITDAQPQDRELLAQKFLSRFEIQWPGRIPSTHLIQIQAKLVSELKRLPIDWTHWSSSYLSWIDRLEEQGFAVDRAAYFAAKRSKFPLTLREEPPFITAEAKVPLTRELAQNKTLLLKTSTNIYRTKFLRALFPNAEFRWILLRRNPLATISALMDGWLSGGFHSHDIHPYGELEIMGYSDVEVGGQRYWKFDMPPGWQQFRAAPLADVCAFQWLSAYQTLDQFRSDCQERLMEVSYEDLLSSNSDRLLQKIHSFCGVPLRQNVRWSRDQAIATVAPPAKGKWKKRQNQILRFIEEGSENSVISVAKNFGYQPEEFEAWP